ncbi:hypothetical protein BC829DRAFT_393660, partial [Chytridium lagenaria]
MVDLVLGTIVYPSQIGFLSGWCHHLGYAYCVFGLVQRGQIGAFLSFAAILEIPSIPLALGHMNKAWRRDYTFGILFFITRVILHGYVVVHAYTTYSPSLFWIVPFIPSPPHLLGTNWLVNNSKGCHGNAKKREPLQERGDPTATVENAAAVAVDAAVDASKDLINTITNVAESSLRVRNVTTGGVRIVSSREDL